MDITVRDKHYYVSTARIPTGNCTLLQIVSAEDMKNHVHTLTF